jgi:D-sedoheptulose 7-phosphate isomerase
MIKMQVKESDILRLFDESSKIILESKILVKDLLGAINIITKSLKNGNKIIIFGNGGSAADAQHMAAEFIGRYLIERKSIPAIALTTDTSILTSIGNDYSFDKVFSRQCESLVEEDDVIIAISTSGNSSNVIEGVNSAKKKGAFTISLTGNSGGKLKKISDITIRVPSDQTPRIQESHRIIIHSICELVEKQFK